jgi:hypothetical protein
MNMPPEVLANDLAFYTEVTSQQGPAMHGACVGRFVRHRFMLEDAML